jgi:hypothetical protein
MTPLNWPLVGSEAIANGRIRKYELRAGFRAEFPDVYVPKEAVLTLRQRTLAGWLWSHRQGVLAGLTASAWHGAKWVDVSSPIELISLNARRPHGLRTYAMRLHSDESVLLRGLRVTTPERTAFDIGRRGRLDEAITRLDALGTPPGSRPKRCLRLPIDTGARVVCVSCGLRLTCMTQDRSRRRKRGCGC